MIVNASVAEQVTDIFEQDYAYQLFASQGWTWRGSWITPKDYQHFQFG